MDTKNVHRPPSRELFFRSCDALSDDEKEMVGAAYEFSKSGHYRQTRASGERYFDHPKAVAWIHIHELGIVEWQSLVVSLLHDIREDTFLLSHQRITLNFGLECALDVDALTHKKGESIEHYIVRIMTRGSRAILVKLCDRLHNVRTLSVMSAEKQTAKKQETIVHYLPLTAHLDRILPGQEKWRASYLRGKLERECL